MFIISTEFKTIETEDVAFAAELLAGLVKRLGAHPGTEVAFWCRDWRARQYCLALAKLAEPDNVGHVAPYPGSYTRGFRSVWK